MAKRDEFLSIKTWAEYNERSAEFKSMEWDNEVIKHWTELANTCKATQKNSKDGWIGELYMTQERQM